MSQCEWILYESGHSFLMKASRILYQTVPDSLQCSCCCLKRTKHDHYRNIRVLFCWKNVLAVYFMLNTCILLVFKQMYYEKQIVKLNKLTKLHISELFETKHA